MPDIGIPSAATPVLKTYLDLVRRLAEEVGATKDSESSIPTLVNAVGETRRFAQWIRDAWRDLQNLHTDWRFLRRQMSFATVDGQATYTQVQCGLADGTLGSIDRDSFRSYLTSAGTNSEIQMDWMEYDEWRDLYQLGAMRVAKTRPIHITEIPDGSIGLGPVPLVGYTILGDYYLAPVDLIGDSDVPTLPAKHSKMLIVYRAMEDHGYFEAATEVLGRAQIRYKGMLSRLEQEQLKDIHGPGALA